MRRRANVRAISMHVFATPYITAPFRELSANVTRIDCVSVSGREAAILGTLGLFVVLTGIRPLLPQRAPQISIAGKLLSFWRFILCVIYCDEINCA
jgi:hypothetical protein